MKYVFAILLALMSWGAVAQTTDYDLAEYYYNNGEYEQARLYYERLYKSDKSNRVYEKYLGTLIALGDLEEAEKIVKKKIKTSAKSADAHVDLGALYKKFGEDEKARVEFDKALKDLEPGRSHALRLANAYIKLNEFDYALETYNKARRISTDGYAFHYEMANLQGMMGNHEAMVDSFMDLLEVSPNYIQTVQNSLNRNLNIQENKANAEMLRTALLKRVQRSPEIVIYNELLIWLFLQKKDFDSALIQAKALDSRNGENGYRLVDIAQLAVNNKMYRSAAKAYQAVIDKGPEFEYYETARIEYLQVELAEITEVPGNHEEQLTALEATYTAALNDLGKTGSTAVLMKELAHIKGFYLGKTDEAIDLLYDAVEIPGLYAKMKAVIKLELGDILLLKDEIWEASLLYSQVELDFKEDVLGHEAKYRNAKVSFYAGDFEWAQAQLDVLKASTSKLISNDAIDLSLLITDNYNMDTTTVAMELYAQADLLAYQNQLVPAFAKLDSITTLFPGHSLTDEILMLKGDVYYNRGEFDKSREYYEQVSDIYSDDILADDALFKLAQLYDQIYKQPDMAQELYNRILTEYPGSLYVVEARKRFRQLRGDEL
ncbi:MAG: tetratricopeptide repeat protein [Flavobacteriales bacterium]|nr:tetratricopeptide repeat protein [Flavobacteriales bacterium]